MSAHNSLEEASKPLPPRDGYQVIADNFVGNGPTPGLALRDLWRSIEHALLQGRPAPYHALPYRRQVALYRKANRGA